MKFNPTPLEIALLLVIGLAIHLWARYGKRVRRWLKEWRKARRGLRQLKPREPGDCPLCRAHICWLHPRPGRHVVPWSEVKSQAGRPKTIDTTGYACFDPDCEYFLITDPTVHALVRDGWRGKDGDILYSIIRLGTREVIRVLLQALELSGRIQTSFVERSYLTLRELVAPLSRRTAVAARSPEHAAPLA